MRAEVAADTGADPDRHIMSQRPTAFVSPDRKRWSVAGNDHARLRQSHRHRNTRNSDAMRGASNRETAVATMHGQKELRSSLSGGPTVRTSAPVQSP